MFSGGHQICLIRGGAELFPALCNAIDAAQHEVWMATYIFHHDPAAWEVAHALVRCASRGVQVRLLVDGFGSQDSLNHLQRTFENTGVCLAIYRPLATWRSWFQPSQLRRLHLKLSVIDHRVAFVGGINLIDDCLDLNLGWCEKPRLDFAVQVQGRIVLTVEQTIRALWTRAWLGQDFKDEVESLVNSRHPIQRLRQWARELRLPLNSVHRPYEVDQMTENPMLASFVLRDNVRQRRNIERSYMAAIRSAQYRIDIISPYFYPGRSLRRALKIAAQRGVKVRLLLQGRWDFKFAGLAARVLYDELLESGIHIYEYTHAYLHAKVAMVDAEWSTVGSSNLDPMSLLLNHEANVMIKDKNFCTELTQHFEESLLKANQIGLQVRTPLHWKFKLASGFVSTIARLYLRVAGVARKY
jgi:cardiolipin synthase A/B